MKRKNNTRVISDTMLVYARTHKNRSDQSLKALVKKFGISDKIKLDKED